MLGFLSRLPRHLPLLFLFLPVTVHLPVYPYTTTLGPALSYSMRLNMTGAKKTHQRGGGGLGAWKCRGSAVGSLYTRSCFERLDEEVTEVFLSVSGRVSAW